MSGHSQARLWLALVSCKLAIAYRGVKSNLEIFINMTSPLIPSVKREEVINRGTLKFLSIFQFDRTLQYILISNFNAFKSCLLIELCLSEEVPSLMMVEFMALFS